MTAMTSDICELCRYVDDGDPGDEQLEATPAHAVHEWEGVWLDVFDSAVVLQPEAALDALATVPKMTADEIARLLTEFYVRRNHPLMESWVVFQELQEGTRYGYRQRIDLWAMCVWQSKGMERIAYEIKVSRSDLLAELRHPWKREYALRVSNRFYFATPPGLMKLSELPEEAGLVEVYPDGKVSFRKGAPRRELPATMELQFVASVLRRAFRHMTGAEAGGTTSE